MLLASYIGPAVGYFATGISGSLLVLILARIPTGKVSHRETNYPCNMPTLVELGGMWGEGEEGEGEWDKLMCTKYRILKFSEWKLVSRHVMINIKQKSTRKLDMQMQ